MNFKDYNVCDRPLYHLIIRALISIRILHTHHCTRILTCAALPYNRDYEIVVAASLD